MHQKPGSPYDQQSKHKARANSNPHNAKNVPTGPGGIFVGPTLTGHVRRRNEFWLRDAVERVGIGGQAMSCALSSTASMFQASKC